VANDPPPRDDESSVRYREEGSSTGGGTPGSTRSRQWEEKLARIT